MDIIKQFFFKIWLLVNPLPEPNAVFILSHMRAGSSLLEHILSSNRQILGTGEQNRVYYKKNDLKKMELFARRNQKSMLKLYKYIIDQILHNEQTPNKNLLINKHIKFIFLIRSPLETITSIENLGGRPYSINRTGKYNPINYYIDRLNELILLSKSLPIKSQFFLTYSDLTIDTNQTLYHLGRFLELKTPLNKVYKLKRMTGKLGDRSENIKIGKVTIIKNKLIELDQKMMEKLGKSYRNTNKYFNFIKQ